MSEATRAARRVVEDYIEMWNEREYEHIPELVTETFVMRSPKTPDGGAQGRSGLEAYIRTLVQGFPDIQISVDELVSEGDVVMLEATIRGTHHGELQGLPPTGREVQFETMEKYYLSGGKVDEHIVCMNEKDLQEELGLTFPAVLVQAPKLLFSKLRSTV